MPERTRFAVVLLVLAACGGDKRAKPAKTAAADAGAHATAHADADAGAHADASADAHAEADAGIALEPLPAGTQLPGGMKLGSRLVGGGRFDDAEGEKYVYLVERASRDRASVALHAVHEVGRGAGARRLRELKDLAEQCPAPSPTAFVDGSLELTDLDGDGVGEVWLAWKVGCGTDARPLVAKQLVLEGNDKYVVRGEGPLDVATEPIAARWPAGWLERATARHEALAAAAAPDAAAGQVLTGDDFETIEVDRAGDLPVDVSYPDLAPLPAALELELTTRMKEFLRVDEVWSADMVGQHDGDCVVGLVTPEVVSIACRHLIDARTKAQAAAGTIGAPADYTRAAFTYWREVGLPSIDPAELAGADRLKRLCGDAARPRFVLDGDGLRWVPDDNHAAPAGCPDGVEWADMEPASPRARALVVRASPANRTPPP